MAIIKMKEIKKLDEKERQKKVGELKLEFAKERANIAIGANVTSPGRLREIRKTIARIKTVENQAGGKSK
jgi:large subunit ribosomal protein L29